MLKGLLKRHRHFLKLFFIYEHVNIFIVVIVYIIYICVKNIAVFYAEFTKKKNNQFFIQKFLSILHVKWTGMNMEEQVENLRFWVNILFEWPISHFAAAKIYLLIFNLTHSFISLMGSFHFYQWEIFYPIHGQILNILGNGIPQLFMLSLKCDHPVLCEFIILFSTAPSATISWSKNFFPHKIIKHKIFTCEQQVRL